MRRRGLTAPEAAGRVGAVLGLLILLFTTVPLLELVLLLWIGSHVGVLPTLALILTTGVLGAALARHQGLATWQRFREALGQGRLPDGELVEGLLILVAAAVLLTPGILTDLTGFLLLVPPIRRLAAARIGRAARRRIVVMSPGRAATGSGPRFARDVRTERPRRTKPGGPSDSGTDPADRAAGDVIDAEFEVLDGDRRTP